MKVVVSSTGKELSSPSSPSFGRCPVFLFVDTDSMQFEAIENPNTAVGGGAGIQSAQLMSDKGVQTVLTGNCGPNAERALSAAGVKLYTGITGAVAEAIELFKAGKLTQSDGPSVQSHFGTDN